APGISKGIEERAGHDPSPPPARRDRTTERSLAHKLIQVLLGVRTHPAHPQTRMGPGIHRSPLRSQNSFPSIHYSMPKTGCQVYTFILMPPTDETLRRICPRHDASPRQASFRSAPNAD